MRLIPRFSTIIKTVIILGFLGGIAGATAAFFLFQHFNKDLPDYSQLANYDPPTTTRFYAADGRLLSEYAVEKRLYVPITAIPKRVINAFLAAEDQNFYHHPGIDIYSVGRAVIQNLVSASQGNRSLVGGSTITQQVVKNFLLTKERTMERKVKEAILAIRISKVYSKDRILELYLNEIYLGAGSYGVTAAALNYFNKPLDELTIEESALLAAMPKAPSSLDPKRFYDRAKTRRDWVIGRMQEEGYITSDEAKQAIATPITMRTRDNTEMVTAESFSGAARQALVDKLGAEAVYERGLSVRTTLDPALQEIAQNALRKGLETYDRRHGYRGPITTVEAEKDWVEFLHNVAIPEGLGNWQLAVVLTLRPKEVEIGISDGKKGIIPFAELQWARHHLPKQNIGPPVRAPSDVVAVGDVIAVEPLVPEEGKKKGKVSFYALRQIPEVNGALVALDPYTGKVLAMVGGYSIKETEFNRAVQAKRQPGSAFKPFVYLTAMENGFSPSSIVLDAPIELSQGAGLPKWTPKNYSGDFLGPTTLRRGLELSKNVMTVRLALMIGIDKIIATGERFGIYQTLPRDFSTVLGAHETTLLNLVNAYGMIFNGGKRIVPSLIERIQDRNGKTIYRHDDRVCDTCPIEISHPEYTDAPPELLDTREPITDPVSAYQITSILQGVVQRGTAQRAKVLNRTLAGKTGTTNESFDSWFIGASPNLVVGVYTGFDTPRTLGRTETGASVALPVFISFMEQALKDKPDVPFRVPPGARLVRVDALTGAPVGPETKSANVIYEAYKPGSRAPTYQPANYDEAAPGAFGGSGGDDFNHGTGGIY